MLALGLAACAPPGPELLLDPDPSRDGTDGADGPYGVARARAVAPARVTEAVRYAVSFPAREDGSPDPRVDPAPLVVWTQGGLVAPDRYQWLATHLASRGAVVVAAEHPADLALLHPDDGRLAAAHLLAGGDPRTDGLVDEDSPRIAAGHSLGGVVAARHWLDDGAFDALVLVASFPAAADAVDARAGDPVLSITGALDGSATVDEVREGLARFAPPATLAVVEGMTHYDWTDGATARERSREPDPARPAAESRRDALRLLDTWLDAWVLARPDAWDALGDGEFPGVALEGGP